MDKREVERHIEQGMKIHNEQKFKDNVKIINGWKLQKQIKCEKELTIDEYKEKFVYLKFIKINEK
jgi:hypothetical protein